jgi:hypothetical protein
MKASCSERARSIAGAADSLGLGARSLSGGRWRIAADGEEPAIDLRVDERWLACSTRVRPVSSAADLWAALTACPSLGGMCKPCVEPRGRDLEARVDVPLSDDTELEDACRNALGDLLSARGALFGLRGEKSGRGDEEPSSETSSALTQLLTSAQDPAAVEAAGGACAEGDWPVVERPDGGLNVDLTGAHGPRHAKIESFGPESHRIHVRLGSAKDLSSAGRTAASILLLTVNDGVRFARTAVAESGGRVEFSGEVWIRERPTGALFDHAFSALALVFRLCQTQLRVLGDQAIARAYLEVRGWSSHARAPRRRGGPQQRERR